MIDKDKEIKKVIYELNRSENIPRYAFRRDKFIYELVSYVNNIVACYTSENFDPIPTLSKRSRNFIENNNVDNDYSNYYKLVILFLDLVNNVIMDNEN